jgi:hypothetical protein
MKKTALLIACAGLVIGGIGMAAPNSANAGIRVSFGTGSYGSNRSYGYNQGYGNFNQGYNNFNRGYGYNQGFNNYNRGNSWSGGYGQPRYIQPGHYDYHPTTIVPHGNHFDVIPGHYDYHQGGHGHGH